jgi:hypothetical protein
LTKARPTASPSTSIDKQRSRSRSRIKACAVCEKFSGRPCELK